MRIATFNLESLEESSVDGVGLDQRRSGEEEVAELCDHGIGPKGCGEGA